MWNQCTRLQRTVALVTATVMFSLISLAIIGAQPWLSQRPTARHVSSAPAAIGHIQIAPMRLDGGPAVPAAALVADTVDNVGARPASLSRLLLQPPPPPPPHDDDGSQPIAGDGVGVPPPKPMGLADADADDEQPLTSALDNIKVSAKRVAKLPEVLKPLPVVGAAAMDAAAAELLEGPKDFKGPTNQRQKAVVNAFRHAWTGYKEFAWGHDNLKPISMVSHDWFGLGLTIVDSLDTMYIMDLQEGE